MKLSPRKPYHLALLSALLVLVATHGCLLSESKGKGTVTRYYVNGQEIAEGTGTVTLNYVEGPWWDIVGDDGKHYEAGDIYAPRLPQDYQVEGLRVWFKAKVIGLSAFRAGEIVEIIAIKRL